MGLAALLLSAIEKITTVDNSGQGHFSFVGNKEMLKLIFHNNLALTSDLKLIISLL
jgi:hypothetical protein